jgi:MFS family permease
MFEKQKNKSGRQDSSGVGGGAVSVKESSWVLAATVGASAMGFISQTAVNVALPAMQASLEATGQQLLWIVNSYNLMLAALILAGGSFGDVLGRKRIFIAGVSLFAAASVACGLAPGTWVLVSARAMQGAGGGLMIPGSLSLITSSFGPERRGRAIGTWAAGTTIATIAGPLVGGLMADAGLWRGVFFINIPLAAAALIILFLKVPASLNFSSGKKIDIPGALLAFTSLAGIPFGLTVAPEWTFGDVRTYGPLAVGTAAMAGFILFETRRENPLVPLKLFRRRTFSGANLITLFLYGALS